MTTPALTVDGVHVALGGRPVLDGVGFEVGAGQVAGLIGSNGAGKTTLMRVVLGLHRPDRGVVRTAGAVGYVPQKVVVDPDLPLRARDLVALGLDGHRLGLRRRRSADRDAVDAAVAAVGADHYATRRVGRLSGGELQRVLIASAIVSRPRVLLLDEPLASLDLRAAQEVVALLDRIAHRDGVAVLLSAHEVNALLPVMDRVVYLAGGHAATGTVDEVVRSDVLSSLYGHPVEVVHAAGRILVVAGTDGDMALELP